MVPSFRELKLITKIDFAIRGTDEQFHIEINDGAFFDSRNDYLSKSNFKLPAKRQLKISTTLGTFGLGFIASTYMTFIMAIGVNPFKSKPEFWIFISTVQILSYIPVLSCVLPINLKYFLVNYFGVSKSSIPFDSFPSWMPNPRLQKDVMLYFHKYPFALTIFLYLWHSGV